MKLIVGTRGSPLALTQTRWVIERLARAHPRITFEVKEIRTQGDARPDAPLASMPRGLFAKELEQALERRSIALAVHSYKDLPTEIDPIFVIAAITEREDPRDVLIAPGHRSLDDLPKGARLGTSSPRRAAQLRHYRPDLEVVPVRGNVGTRITKAGKDGLAGVVIAAAGVKRLGREGDITCFIDPEICTPEAGQGALAVEALAGERSAIAAARSVDHADTRAAVTAEITAVAALGGGCSVPIAAFAEVRRHRLELRGMVADPSGRKVIRASVARHASDPVSVGRLLAERLVAGGAHELLAGVAT
ncbi:MAG: hydroxymethylbilane synthase [Chloroflexi bacterium]|nr:hydroxymethylbilane synthase [Chloroflexota bacterium]